MSEPLRVERHIPSPHTLAPSLVARASVLCLAFGERCRSRLRANLTDGREVALFLARGTVLRGGDLLVSQTGELIRVEARAEPVHEVRGQGERDLIRAAYHLGNRHIRVELGTDCLRFEADSVLKTMLTGLGLAVLELERPFEPEPGAYGGGHRHGHEDSFAEDYALAQATYALHEPAGANAARPHAAPLHLRKHNPAHDHRHDHPHRHPIEPTERQED